MKAVFADTSFFVAAIGPRDQYHQLAVEFMQSHEGPVITTDFVLVEFGSYLYRIKDRPYFEPVLQNVRSNPQYEIVAASRELSIAGSSVLSVGRTRNGR